MLHFQYIEYFIALAAVPLMIFFLCSIKKMEKSYQQKNRGPCIGKGAYSGLFV
jgi:hypothetical protein